MTNMNSEASNKFISALVKALQTLCHGYVEFNDGVEIIGHIYLNIDSGSSFDYVVKEKLCKNAENSTVFVSKSFQAQAPAEESSSKRDREDVSAEYDNSLSPTVGTSRLQSAIASMSNVLSGSQDQKPRFMGHSSHHHHHHLAQNPVKRKRDHNDQFNNLQPPFKYTTLQTPSSSSSSSVAAIYFNSGQQPKQLGERNHFGSGSHGTDYLPPDSNRSSAMDPEDEDDLNLDVTFVKEEYENQRNAGHKANVARLGQVTDLSTNQTTVLHPGTTGGLVFPTSHQQQHLPQEFTTGTPADTGGSSSSQTFQDSSQMNLTQQAGPSVPNPRNKTAGDDHPTFQAPAMPIKYFRCPVCSIIIRHKNNIKRHMRRHNDLAAAAAASASGSTDVSKAWTQHFITSSPGTQFSGGRQMRHTYNCPICGLVISHRKNIRRHMRKHTGEMFFCDLCDWRGTCRWKLQKHREKKHGILTVP